MPVTSTRRYSSSSYLTPSTTTSSSLGSYRSNYSSSISTSSSKDLPPSSSRYNFSDSTYRPSYRSSLTSSSLSSTSNGTSGSYRSRYDFDDTDKKNKYSSLSTTGSSSSSLSTRIGVSKTSSSNSRYNSDTLPPLPPSSSVTNAHNHVHSKRSLSRSRDQNDSGESNGVGSSKNGDRSATNGKLSLMNDLDFYEKYSPSRYMTKYELSRSRSLSEAAQTPTRDKSPSSSSTANNDTPTHTPKSEVCQEITSTLALSLSCDF